MTDYIAEAIEEAWGERCKEFSPVCHVCLAWKQYDDLLASLETMTGIAETFGVIACFGAHPHVNGPEVLDSVKEVRSLLARYLEKENAA